MKNPKSDICFSIILLLFTGFIYQQTYKFPKEAALFPRIFTVALAILTLILLFKSLKAMKSIKAEEVEEVKKTQNYKSPTLIVVGLVVYALVLKILGYIISTFLLSSYVIYVLGYKDVKKMVLTSAVGTGLIYVVFKTILGVNLPEIFFMM